MVQTGPPGVTDGALRVDEAADGAGTAAGHRAEGGPRRPAGTVVGVVLAVAAVVALLVGAGAFSSTPPTPAQRAAAIESTIRCPSCQDLSVAQSTAPTAVTVRATVARLIAAGQSDDQIRTYLVDRYGTSIDLLPPTSGWSVLIWVLPVAGLAVALAAAGAVLGRRRRGRDGLARPGALADAASDPRAAADTRRFLEASLADAEAEFAAGDLSGDDYRRLRDRDEARLAALDELVSGRADAERGVTPSGPAVGGGEAPVVVRRPRRRRLLVGALVAFAAALVLVVALSLSHRQPGQVATGSVAQTEQQQVATTLDQAASDVNAGDETDAATLYQSVLAAHPDNEVALAQLGWIEVQVGRSGGGGAATLVADGRAKLERAVVLDPADPAAHLYLGTTRLLVDGDAAGAVVEYRAFLADDPPASLVRQAAPTVRRAFQQAGLPVPARVAG